MKKAFLLCLSCFSLVILAQSNVSNVLSVDIQNDRISEKNPMVKVVKCEITGDKTGEVSRNEKFYLKFTVQNIGDCSAKDVSVNLNIPEGIIRTGGDYLTQTFPVLYPNEKKIFDYELISTDEVDRSVRLEVAISERYGKYSENHPMLLTFIESDVDINIPKNYRTNKNMFAVIIANENYRTLAPVPYALNDGSVFRDYCLKTLGIPSNQVHYVPDATLVPIKDEIKWLQDVCHTHDSVQIIFYYAGHGIPDENTNEAYLIPVDGKGANIVTCYSLNKLYSTLSATKAANITYFLDACFTGANREGSMLVAARGVAREAKKQMLRGSTIVFAAASQDETAMAYKEKTHGMFTYFLLKKLQNTKGDVNAFCRC